jgi:hypothetical protein
VFPSRKTPSPSIAQNVPKVERRRPTANLMVFSGTRASGLWRAIAAIKTMTAGDARARAASGMLSALTRRK